MDPCLAVETNITLDHHFSAIVLAVLALGAKNSSDERVLLPGTSQLSAGWEWFRQVRRPFSGPVIEPASLYELQLCCVSAFNFLTRTFVDLWLLLPALFHVPHDHQRRVLLGAHRYRTSLCPGHRRPPERPQRAPHCRGRAHKAKCRFSRHLRLHRKCVLRSHHCSNCRQDGAPADHPVRRRVLGRPDDAVQTAVGKAPSLRICIGIPGTDADFHLQGIPCDRFSEPGHRG